MTYQYSMQHELLQLRHVFLTSLTSHSRSRFIVAVREREVSILCRSKCLTRKLVLFRVKCILDTLSFEQEVCRVCSLGLGLVAIRIKPALTFPHTFPVAIYIHAGFRNLHKRFCSHSSTGISKDVPLHIITLLVWSYYILYIYNITLRKLRWYICFDMYVGNICCTQSVPIGY